MLWTIFFLSFRSASSTQLVRSQLGRRTSLLTPHCPANADSCPLFRNLSFFHNSLCLKPDDPLESRLNHNRVKSFNLNQQSQLASLQTKGSLTSRAKVTHWQALMVLLQKRYVFLPHRLPHVMIECLLTGIFCRARLLASTQRKPMQTTLSRRRRRIRKVCRE